VWKKVQAKPVKALRKFDQIIAVAFDETWMAEAVVADARNETVVLAKPRGNRLCGEAEEGPDDAAGRDDRLGRARFAPPPSTAVP
jgi:hypothetical protein